MKILVVGGTGVIGRRVVPLFVAAGHQVDVVSRSAAKSAQIRAAGASPVAVEVFRPGAVAEVVAGHQAVINLATHIPRMRRAWRSSAWLENDQIRREVSRNLVDAALASQVQRYVQESIALVYADGGSSWLAEDAPIAPTPITESVLVAEDQARRFAAAGRAGVVLRFGLLYAPEAASTRSAVKSARRGFGATFGRDDGYVSMIHADDAAAAVVAALEAPSGCYNIVEDEPATKLAFMDALAASLGMRRLNTTGLAMAALGGTRTRALARSLRVSNRSFREVTGWRPAYPNPLEGWPAVVAAMSRG